MIGHGIDIGPEEHGIPGQIGQQRIQRRRGVPADRPLVGGRNPDGGSGLARSLVGRIERPDGFQIGAEEFEANRPVLVGGPEIEDAPAYGGLAAFGDLVHEGVTRLGETGGQGVEILGLVEREFKGAFDEP